MKIAFVCGRDIAFAQDTDGGSVLIRNLAEAFGRRGHAVTVFTPGNLGGGAYRPLKKRADFPSPRGALIRRFDVPEGEALEPLTRSGAYFRNRMALSERLAGFFADGTLHAYDRVFIFHAANAFGLFALGYCPPERTVLFPMLLGSAYALFEPVPAEYLRAEEAMLRRARHVAAASRAEERMLHDAYGVSPARTLVLRRGFDPRVFAPHPRAGARRDRTHLLCANAIRPQKNQRFFLDFVAAARGAFPRLVVHLMGVGSENPQSAYGAYARALARDIERRGLREHFALHPVAPQRAVAELMRRCDFALYPSITETFGKSLLESVVSGLPTVAFDDVPAYREFIEPRRTGLLVPRSVAAAAGALQELRADAALYRRISAEGAGEAPRFTWDTTVAEFLRALEARREGREPLRIPERRASW